MLSVLCITYNQEKFVREALDSFLSQKTDFPYEIVIADDGSTDGTREIIQGYKKRYPDMIRPQFRDINVGSLRNFYLSYNVCRGRYIAICDGDDHWTDPDKLQKQVDFLERNPEFSMTSHAVKTVFLGVEKKDPFVKPLEISTLKETIEHGHFVPTLSIVLRRTLLPKLPPWFQELWVDDIPLIMMMTALGKNYYFKEVMGYKRKHPLGISQEERRKTKEYKIYMLKNKLFFFNKLKVFLNGNYEDLLNKVLSEIHFALMFMYLKKGRLDKSAIHLMRSILASPKWFIVIVSDQMKKLFA